MALNGEERKRLVVGAEPGVSGQWRAMPDGITGIPGNRGNVVRHDGDVLIARVLHGRRDQAAAWSESGQNLRCLG